MRRIVLLLVGLVLLLPFWQGSATTALAQDPAPQSPSADYTVYLPSVSSRYSSPEGRRTINAPFFTTSDVMGQKYSEMAIAWFGKVTPTENYTDIRVGYNSTDLFVHLVVFDRRLWSLGTLTYAQAPQGDSASLYLDVNGIANGLPQVSSYKFVTQWYKDGQNYPGGYSSGVDDSHFELAYRGDGRQWQPAAVPFYTLPGWGGDAPNNNVDDNAWAMTLRVSFASLGLSGPPANLSEWSLALEVNDWDDSIGTPIPAKTWPENAAGDSVGEWGRLRFGSPSYTPAAYTTGDTVTVRHGLNGAYVPDGAVGGNIGHLCDNSGDYWNVWGNRNFAPMEAFVIQNQSKPGDWPCFSKYYVTFPMSAVPAGKVIVSATVTLYEWGGSYGDPPPGPSLIQALVVGDNWTETGITWNNAPLPVENVAQTWVPVYVTQNVQWPGQPSTWNVSRAVAEAYASGQPLRLSFYEADSQFHSGKYFVGSHFSEHDGTPNWNAAGRPTLTIVWGNPAN